MSEAITSPRPDLTPEARNAFRIGMVLLIAASVTELLAVYMHLRYGRTTLGLAAIGLLLVFCITTIISLWRAHTGDAQRSAWLIIIGLLALFPVMTLILQDSGLLFGVSLILAVAAVAGLTLPTRPARLAIVAAVIGGSLGLFADLYFESFGAWQRLVLPERHVGVYLPFVVLIVITAFGVLLGRQITRYRLSTKVLVGFLAVALLPLTLVSLRIDQESRTALRNAASQSLFTAASQTAAEIDAFVNANLAALSAEGRFTAFSEFLTASLDERIQLSPELRRLMATLQARPPEGVTGEAATRVVQAYLLLDSRGEIALTTAVSLPDTALLKGKIFTVPMTTLRPYASPVYFGAGESGVWYFSAPVFSEDQRPVGVLVAQVNAYWLQRIIVQSNDRLGPNTRSFAALFDENGLRLADGLAEGTNVPRYTMTPDPARLADLQAQGLAPKLALDALEAHLAELAESLAKVRASGEAPVFYTGVVHYAADPAQLEPVHLAAFAPLKTEAWVVMYAQPESVALAPARAQTRTTIVLAFLFALATALVSTWVARALTSPIQQLTQAAQRVSTGDLAARAPVLSQDEIGQLTNTFNRMTEQLQQTLGELETRVNERTAQLQATADISRATAGIRDLDELLELAIEMIRGRFGFYHAAVFLMNESGEYAVLREATGDVGAALKPTGYKLAIGSRSLVGWVTQNRRLRVARDVADDPFYLKHPLLPETRSELSIPLIVGERLLGVLDVQSRDRDAFSETDLQALQVLADQLSVAIENAEFFERTQAALAETRALYQQTLLTGWRELVAAQSAPLHDMELDLEPGGAVSETPIVIPLRLRNQVVGVIELHGRPGDAPLSAEEQAVLETVAAQLATALESAALVQESQIRSRRDQLITSITDEIRATLNPAFILQNGIRQLGRALGASEVMVKLKPTGKGPQPEERP